MEEYKKELQEWGKTEREKLAVLESNAVIQSKLSQANTEVTRKQTEVIYFISFFKEYYNFCLFVLINVIFSFESKERTSFCELADPQPKEEGFQVQ